MHYITYVQQQCNLAKISCHSDEPWRDAHMQKEADPIQVLITKKYFRRYKNGNVPEEIRFQIVESDSLRIQNYLPLRAISVTAEEAYDYVREMRKIEEIFDYGEYFPFGRGLYESHLERIYAKVQEPTDAHYNFLEQGIKTVGMNDVNGI